MGFISNLLQGLGIVHDVFENTRTTTTDVKDNKPESRKYDFDDGTGYTPEDFLEERKKRHKDRNKNGKDANKEKKETENVR